MEPATPPPRKTAFVPVLELPRAPASDLKRIGWRGIMNSVRGAGPLLVTNHDQPEAVILPAAEYDALMQIVGQIHSQATSVLSQLREDFDARLLALQEPSAAERLRAVIRDEASLGGKVKAGSGY